MDSKCQYRAHRSATRCSHSLGDIHCLPVDPLSQRGVHGSPLYEVYLRYPKNFFNSVLHPEQVKDAHGTPELNKKVNITPLPRLIPDNRPEKGKGSPSSQMQILNLPSDFASLRRSPIFINS